MNEIEKMYENAGVELIESLEWVCQNPCHCTYQNLSIVPENCSGCKSFQIEMIYPPFTAEKQLELIKWLSQHTYRNYIKFRFDICGLWYCECNMLNSDMHHTFEDALAQIVNNLWQDLTSEEKQQIKEILE